MPRSLIVYFSQTATTARVAEAIAAGLRSAEYQVDLCNMKEQRAPDPGGYDLLGIGSPVYFYRPPFRFRDYLNGLPQLNGLPAFTFVLHGTYRGDTGTVIRHIMAGKGGRVLSLPRRRLLPGLSLFSGASHSGGTLPGKGVWRRGCRSYCW